MIEARVERKAFKGGARNHGDRVVMDKQSESFSATTFIDPWLGFQIRIEDRRPCDGKAQMHPRIQSGLVEFFK